MCKLYTMCSRKERNYRVRYNADLHFGSFCFVLRQNALTQHYSISSIANLHCQQKSKDDGPCLGKRDGPGVGPYRWTTYSEVIKKVHLIGSGLLNMGISRNNATNIGIYSSNRNEVDTTLSFDEKLLQVLKLISNLFFDGIS